MSKREAHKPIAERLTRRPLHSEYKNTEENDDESESSEDFSVEELVKEKQVQSKKEESTLQEKKVKDTKKGYKKLVDTEQRKLNTFSEKKHKTDVCSHITNYRIIFVFVGMLILLICVYIFTPQQELKIKNKNLSSVLEDVKSHFEKLKKQQPNLTYRIITIQLRKVFNVSYEPKAPAILTFLADKGAKLTASEFSDHLAKALEPGEYILLNSSSYWNGDPDDIKEKIDEEINSKYLKNDLNVIVIDNLQKIPVKAAMIFHSYCDHENSPFKRAVFMFILPLDKIIPLDVNTKYLDEIAMKSLRSIWSKATDDEIDSLITRIAVSVVNIK